MAIGRRGFLFTLAAAAVGAATFDPKSLLWVPTVRPIVPVELSGTSAAAVIAEQLELNDIAMRFAKEMASRLERHPSVTLREVMFKHAGHVHLPGSLDVEDMGRGSFVPMPTRVMKVGVLGHSTADYLATMGDQMASDIRSRHDIDMFAPIGADLRPGVPFSECAIGVATDPESGISVRALRFLHEGRGPAQTLTGVELAAGRWAATTARPRKPLFLEG